MNKLTQQEIQKIIDASNVLNIVDYSILEKDIFVTRAIKLISEINQSILRVIFCGGTCLAKAYKTVSRMSEDVDFKFYPVVPFTSRSDQKRKLKNFKDAIEAQLKKSGFKIYQENINARSENEYLTFKLDYPSLFNPHSELRPHIQLEFTLAHPRLPTENKTIASIVDRMFPQEKHIEHDIECISILETAAEKWVALTRRISLIERGYDKMDETLVRHLYDLYSITGSVKLNDVFFHLVSDTVERDKSKFKKHQEYIADHINEINYSLSALKKNKDWMKNYKNFLETMVFDSKKASFKNCYVKLSEISEKIIEKIQLLPSLKKDSLLLKKNIFSKALIKQLRSYVEMQVSLQRICDEKMKNHDPVISDKLLHKAKIANGRIKKLAKDIFKFPEVSSHLSKIDTPEKHVKKRQADVILERFKKNEINMQDIDLILRHVQKNA